VKDSGEPGAPDGDADDLGATPEPVPGWAASEKAQEVLEGSGQDLGEDLAKIDDRYPPWLSWVVARRQTYRRRKKRSGRPATSLWVGAALVALTGINLYVFFGGETPVNNLANSANAKTDKSDKAGKAGENDQAAPAGKGAKGISKLAMLPAKVASPGGAKPAESGASGEVLVAAPEPRVVEGSIGDNDTLGAVIDREGLGSAAPAVLRALSRLHDPKSIRPGDRYTVTFSPEGAPLAFEFSPSPILRYVITPAPDGSWVGRKEEKPIVVRTETAGGNIDSSLYESVAKAGEGPALASQLVELFAWDINFYTDTHPGDRWRMVVEKQYLDGKFYRYGQIHAAEYSGRAGTFRAFAWSSATGHGPVRYFTEKGEAITKSFLKTPLRFVRVSSKFNRNRFHPVLHVNKAHLGVDYAAPIGTPVWASASGRVVECAMKPGSGKTVVIEHGGGLATRYYHLSKFAPGMRAGRQVRQKEIIGYVGTTGLSTGPHLHFALTRNGAFVDPSKMQAVRETPVADKTAFMAAIKPHLNAMTAFRGGPPAPPPRAPAPAAVVKQ
jgi:murein DD-endopeptidase MepM/ murein hydrolase activator NlpD/uncharacterized membrane protein